MEKEVDEIISTKMEGLSLVEDKLLVENDNCMKETLECFKKANIFVTHEDLIQMEFWMKYQLYSKD